MADAPWCAAALAALTSAVTWTPDAVGAVGKAWLPSRPARLLTSLTLSAAPPLESPSILVKIAPVEGGKHWWRQQVRDQGCA